MSNPVVKKSRWTHVTNDGKTIHYRSVSRGDIWTPVSADIGLQTTQIMESSYCLPNKSVSSQGVSNKSRSVQRVSKKSRSVQGVSNKSRSSRRTEPFMSRKRFMTLLWMVVFLLIVFLAIFIKIELDKEWSFSPIKNDLIEVLHQQNEARNALELAIGSAIKNDASTLIVIKGGVGVGKSVAASAIYRNFPWPYNARLVSLKYLWSSFSLIPGLFNMWHLLVLEDCDRTTEISEIYKVIKDVKLDGLKLLTVLVCTVNNEKENDQLTKVIAPLEPYIDVFFEALNHDTVRKCLIREITKMNVTISEEKLNRLILQQMQIIPEIGGPPGCKQVDTTILKFL